MYFYLPVLASNNDFLTPLTFPYLLVQFYYEEKIFYGKKNFYDGRLKFLILLMEKAMAPHSSTLAWKIPWMEEPGRLQSMGSRGVGHD